MGLITVADCSSYSIHTHSLLVDLVYLLDDPLSAVDSHVGAGLFAKGIINSLKNRGKGVVLGKLY